MRRHFLMALLALCLMLILGLMPAAATGDGSSAENPIVVPDEGYTLNTAGTGITGIDEEWLSAQKEALGLEESSSDIWLALEIPAEIDGTDITSISVTSAFEKTSGNNYSIASVDFTKAVNLTSISRRAFYSRSEMGGAIDLSNTSITNLSNDLLFYNTRITSVTFPKGLKTIGGKQIFYSCTALTEAIFPEGNTLTTLGESTFNGCSSLVNITIPDGVTSIGKNVFNGCSSLNITIPERITSIGESAFSRTAIESVSLEHVTSLGASAFRNCKNLKGIIQIPNRFTVIPKELFSECTSLEGIIISDDVTEIGDSAFNGCRSLQFIRTASSKETAVFELPKNLEKIGQRAFRNCFDPAVDARVILPAGVASVGSDAFYNSDGKTQAIRQILVMRTGDGWGASFKNYENDAFDTRRDTDRIVVFQDYRSYLEFGQTREDTLGCIVEITFKDPDGNVLRTEKKLHNQSMQYTQNKETGYWEIDPDYTLPAHQSGGEDGYDYGWTYFNGNVTTILQETSKLYCTNADSKLTITQNKEPSKPAIQPTVDGVVVEGAANPFSLAVDLTDGKTHTVGLEVTHPLATEEARASGTYVYFQYTWWDLYQNLYNGPRTQEENTQFSYSENSATFHRNMTDLAEVEIRSKADERVGDDWYQIEIWGYYVENYGTPERFYQSSLNGIAITNPGPTDSTCFAIHVSVAAPPVIAQIQIKTQPKLTYTEGDALDLSDLVLTVTYSDGSEKDVPYSGTDMTFAITDGTPMINGTTLSVAAHHGQTITVTYQGKAVETNPLAVTAGQPVTPDSGPTPGGDLGASGGEDSRSDPYLRFESNGGTKFDPIAAEDPFTLNPYDDAEYGVHVPSRPGHRFTGWYRDRNLSMRVDEEEALQVRGAVTLFAGWAETTVPALLNGGDHYAYIQGYSDGSVRPNENITRAQVAAIIFRLLEEDVREDHLTTDNAFRDVSRDHWANTAISTVASLGLINGRDDGTFDPEAPITRAEFAAICARFDDSVTAGDSSFTDTAGHWAEAEIGRVAALGWVQGYIDGSFRPDSGITRAQAVTMMNRVLCRLPESAEDLLPGMNTWTDCHAGDWFYLAIQEATNSHDFAVKGRTYETWTGMKADPDWSRYE